MGEVYRATDTRLEALGRRSQILPLALWRRTQTGWPGFSAKLRFSHP